ELYYVEECPQSRGYEAEQQIKGHAVGWDGLLAHTEGVCKMLSITSGSEETDARTAILREHFGGTLNAVRSNACYAELLMPGVTKATALVKLAEVLGVDISEVMAIGDAENDLPMLQAAGHAVAMGNAVPAVKAACEYETSMCEADGVAQAIDKWVIGNGD
ncbi:MAG: HAD hydrolase family protein, partial [Selenomonas sp.]|nr:HAD hydrolase family protein [Selenomonas sp.]